jgi:hypothetical protein
MGLLTWTLLSVAALYLVIRLSVALFMRKQRAK